MDQLETTRRCRNLFMRAAAKLAETGVDPVAIAEAGLVTGLKLSQSVIGRAALVAWLREAATEIEADDAADSDRGTVQ
jgi:hypothetical protein